MLKTLHLDKHILNDEECRRVRKSGDMWNELAAIIAMKPHRVVQDALDVLEEYKGKFWAVLLVKRISAKNEEGAAQEECPLEGLLG